MKAATYASYGAPDVVGVTEIAKPLPEKNELLVKIHYSAITAADSRIRAARFPGGFSILSRLVFGIFAPRKKVLGSIFSGVVEAVGEDVSGFSVGDAVCGSTGISMGAHAEYITISTTKTVVHKPDNVSHYDAAALLFGASAAYSYLIEKAHLTSGKTVLVNGAAGAVGTCAVQLAKHFGCHVTGVATADQAELVKSLGAEKTIDYKTETIYSDTYDMVIDTVGNISSKSGKSLLKPGGKVLLLVASIRDMLSGDKQVVTGVAQESKEQFTKLLTLIGSGALRPVVDSEFPLDNIVSAHRRAEDKGKNGAVLVRLS